MREGLIALYVSLIHELMGAGYGSYLPPGSEWGRRLARWESHRDEEVDSLMSSGMPAGVSGGSVMRFSTGNFTISTGE